MTDYSTHTIFDWFANQFIPKHRAEEMGPHLALLVKPGDRVLDLGCATGVIAFYLEDRGATVTGVDISPTLIGLAQEAAHARNSRSTFIQGDILNTSFEAEAYDLAICLGNVILEFPHSTLATFRDRIYQALEPSGLLALEHKDGVLRFLDMRSPAVVIEEGVEGPVERRHLHYDPERGAFLTSYYNTVTGETQTALSYIHTGPMLRAVMEPCFTFVESTRLERYSYLDLYRRR
jgi:SAM-dependent methyltransferase